MANRKTSRTYNVLFLGETQSGKSTLIESLIHYNINKDNIGDGIFSLTKVVTTTTIHTNLPSYFVTDMAGKQVDHRDFLNGDQEDYLDELNDRKRYRLEREEPTFTTATFNLIDTPGLNDTTVTDEVNIAKIFKGLKGIRSIDLVVITVTNNPFTDFLVDALKVYVSLLPELNSNVVFVHTRFDYSRLHPEERTFEQPLREKKHFFGELVGRDSVPHFMIDNDIGSVGTIRNCITQNTLRGLLAIAKLNQPVPLQIMYVNKTEKMRAVEIILKQKCDAKITALEAELLGENETKETVLKRRVTIENEIATLEQDLQPVSRDLAYYDKDTLHLLYKERPDHIDIQEHNIEVARQAGGVGENHWAVQFRRRRHQDGVYHVKIYVKKSKKYVRVIERLRTRELAIKSTILELQSERWDCGGDVKGMSEKVRELMEDLGMWRHILGRISAQQLYLGVFQAMVDDIVYVREDSVSAANLERFFWEKKTKIEEHEESARSFSMPSNQDEEMLELVDSDEHVEDSELFAETEEKDARREAEEEEALALAESTKETAPSPFPSPNRLELLQTGTTKEFIVTSDLPSHEVCHEDSHETIDTEVLCQSCINMDDYAKAIDNRKTTCRLAQQNPNHLPEGPVTIKFLDTPGINDTNYRDVEHAKRIIDEMLNVKSFNLIVVIVNIKHPIHMEQRIAFNYYSRVIHALQGHLSNVVFVYTHVEYKCRHHTNINHHESLDRAE
ncbi:hypothetical protein BGZ74_009308 [Mortierella antarctica]|nr:hypothetical protein BGZ74_009308 [Mortierella antarctica]